MVPSAKQQLSGWGGFPREECAVFRPEKRRAVSEIVASAECPHYIARGLGRSYGDAAVNTGGGVVCFVRLNRMLAFDGEAGVLEAESGVSLAEIIETFLPRGWFLPVTPGTKFVTLGGAIAHDVHGKNHHRDGSFGQFVLDFTLLTPRGDVLVCSREQNSDVFWATVGGAGLTGMLLTARVRLQRVSSAYIRVDYRRCPDIDSLLAAIRETDQRYQYSVAWVDCLSKGKALGRSVLMSGDHVPAADLPGRDPFHAPPKRKPNVPFNMPEFVLNSASIGLFNEVFYRCHPSAEGKILGYDPYFYPLDAIHDWYRIYGKRGFTQYQATFPYEGAEGLLKLLEKFSQSSRASFLAVLKRMGPPSGGLLSHPLDGWTLTLDLPWRDDLLEFLQTCDRIVLNYGGRLYMAKDATTTPEIFAAMYPRLDEFRAIKARLDPYLKLSSRLARRVGIVENGLRP